MVLLLQIVGLVQLALALRPRVLVLGQLGAHVSGVIANSQQLELRLWLANLMTSVVSLMVQARWLLSTLDSVRVVHSQTLLKAVAWAPRAPW